MNCELFYPGEIFNGNKDYLGIYHATINGSNILCIGYNEAVMNMLQI